MSNNTTWNDESARATLRRIFDAAVKSAALAVLQGKFKRL